MILLKKELDFKLVYQLEIIENKNNFSQTLRKREREREEIKGERETKKEFFPEKVNLYINEN